MIFREESLEENVIEELPVLIREHKIKKHGQNRLQVDVLNLERVLHVDNRKLEILTYHVCSSSPTTP